ncbi:MAG: hypothetical protein JNL65_04945 [Saprospiraceae bacterium]|nr:hypothetical protein [Saprospiraceae bacterium]
MSINLNSSSKENPVEYFNYLFTRNGLHYLLQEFIPTEDDFLYGNIQYDSTTKTITEYTELKDYPNEYSESKEKFDDFFLNRLYNEYLLSRIYIDNRIKELPNEHSIKHYLKLVIIDLYYLNAEIKRNEVLNVYKFSSKPINALLRFLRDKYPDFIPDRLNGITDNVSNIALEKENENEKVIPPPHPKVLKTFKWLPNSESELLEILWEKLSKDSKFILASTELKLFKKAFSGSFDMPESKIQWMVKGINKDKNKKILIYLLDNLVSAGLIEKYKTKIIGFVFSDFNGNSFENLSSSKSMAKHWNTTPPDYEALGNIVDLLKSSKRSN